MVSEHASPLAVLGGVDAGGQNVHVAAFAAELARLGHSVTVYTRRDDEDTPVRVTLASGVVVEHVPAGPPRTIPNAIDRMLPYMGAFSQYLTHAWRRDRPDFAHAHFWMSGLAALGTAQPLGIPIAQTFHALGVVKRRHQGVKDTSPPERIPTERRIVAEADLLVAQSSDEVFELIRLGADQRRIAVISSGVDVARFSPDSPRWSSSSPADPIANICSRTSKAAA